MATGQLGVMGALGAPVGTVLTVQGVVVESPIKGIETGPNLRIQRINGRATQDDIQLRLSPFLYKFGEPADEGALPELDYGHTYEFEGYETGQFLGVPVEAHQHARVTRHETIFHFSHRLVVYSGKKIEPVNWSPGDFVDREALIEGRAVE